MDTQRADVKDGWEVLITTYNLAQGDERDRKFFRKINWQVSCNTDVHIYRHLTFARRVFSTKAMS